MRNTNFNSKNSGKIYPEHTKTYDQLIINKLVIRDEYDEDRWTTYDTILFELQNEGNYQTYEEIRYRLTDGEPTNEVFYDIISRGDYSSGLIWIMKQRIEEYLDEDKFKRFYK